MQGRTALEWRPPLLWGVSKMNGWQIDTEDRMLVEYYALVGFGVFGVINGLGNSGHAFNYVARNLQGKLMSRPEWVSAYLTCNPNLFASLITLA